MAISLTIDGKQVALKKGSSIEYVSENRIFTDADDYSMEIELPLADCPQNIAVFGHLTRKDVDTDNIFFNAVLQDTKFLKVGAVVIIGITNESVKVQFLEKCSYQNFYPHFDETYFDKLDLELSEEKTLITHTGKPAKFLGYEITVSRCNLQRRDIRGRLKRTYGNRARLKVNTDKLRNKLLEYGAMNIKIRNGKEVWNSIHRSNLICNDDLEILNRYNQEMRGFCNYYLIANNCAVLSSFQYIMEYSMYKTLAAKYKSSIRKINRKYRKNGEFAVRYNHKGIIKFCKFYRMSFKRHKTAFNNEHDIQPITIQL